MSGQWSVVCEPGPGLSQGTREKTGARVTVCLKPHIASRILPSESEDLAQ